MWYRTLLGLALLATVASTGSSQETATRVAGRVESRLWIEGSSNLSRWSCKATSVDAAIYVDSNAADFATLVRHVRSVTVRVPVAALTCGHAPMDRSLRAALNADDAPASANIVATLDAITGDDSASHTVHTAGSLRLAGRENAVKVDLSTSLGDDGLEARGELPIRMSEYGIVPPTGLFGAIRCADRVVVKFALTVVSEASAVSATALSLPH